MQADAYIDYLNEQERRKKRLAKLRKRRKEKMEGKNTFWLVIRKEWWSIVSAILIGAVAFSAAFAYNDLKDRTEDSFEPVVCQNVYVEYTHDNEEDHPVSTTDPKNRICQYEEKCLMSCAQVFATTNYSQDLETYGRSPQVCMVPQSQLDQCLLKLTGGVKKL